MMRARGFTDRHPDVVQAIQELALLDDRIDGPDLGEEGVPGSYAEQNAKSEERRSALRVEALTRDAQRLTEQGEDARKRLAATPAVAAVLEALAREYSHLNASFQDFSARRQQASVQADLERKQLGEQFRILEFAFPAPRPSSPNRRLILFLGLVVGVGMAGAIGLLLESLDSAVHDSRSLQAATSVPVLASIPAIMLEPDFAARRRQRAREILVAGGIVALFLLGGAVSYVYVNDVQIFPSSDAGEEDRNGESEARRRIQGMNLGWNP
jgi:hypothetical protein